MLATLQHRLRELNNPYADGPYDTARIGEGRSFPPYQRRILVPFMAVTVHRATGVELATIELVIRGVSLWAVLIVLDRLMILLGASYLAVSVPLLFAALIPLGFYVNPVVDSFPATLVVLIGMCLITLRRYLWLTPLILIGTTVRESTVLIPVVFLLNCAWMLPLQRFVALLLLQLLAYVGTRLFLRELYPGPDLVFALWFNVQHLFQEGLLKSGLRLSTAFFPMLLAGVGLHRLGGQMLVMAAVGLVYACGLLLVSRMNEPRVFYEAYALMSPAMLHGLIATKERPSTGVRGGPEAARRSGGGPCDGRDDA